MNEHDARKSERTRCSRLVLIGAKNFCHGETITKAIEGGLTPQQFEEQTAPGAEERAAEEEQRKQDLRSYMECMAYSEDAIAMNIKAGLTVEGLIDAERKALKKYKR